MRSINPDAFIARLHRRGYEQLGSGCFSVVLAKPGSDKVIKVNKPDNWLDYVLWAAKHGYAGSHAPRVYSYHCNDDGTYNAVVERMEQTLENLYGSATYTGGYMFPDSSVDFHALMTLRRPRQLAWLCLLRIQAEERVQTISRHPFRQLHAA